MMNFAWIKRLFGIKKRKCKKSKSKKKQAASEKPQISISYPNESIFEHDDLPKTPVRADHGTLRISRIATMSGKTELFKNDFTISKVPNLRPMTINWDKEQPYSQSAEHYKFRTSGNTKFLRSRQSRHR